MAISRAGQLPIDFEYRRSSSKVPKDLLEAFARNMHRFLTFVFDGDMTTVDFSRPAPLLRKFVYDGWPWAGVIPPDFLGSSIGQLRELHLRAAIFPAVCPALETVRHLRATYPEHRERQGYTPHFDRLFDLCPRLEVLHLHDLEGAAGVELPRGPAPQTLRNVKLNSWWHCDLSQLYTAWQLHSVPDVQLETGLQCSSTIVALVAGALELAMTSDPEDEEKVLIVAHLSNSRNRTFAWDDVRNGCGPAPLLAAVLKDGAAFAQMQALDVPLSALRLALPAARHWPRLAHLTVRIYEYDPFDGDDDEFAQQSDKPPFDIGVPEFRLRWTFLECLRNAPALETLLLKVHMADGSESPSLDDARNLREQLFALSDCIPREVSVYGFPDVVVHALLPGEMDNPRVAFMADNLDG
ncbi:hypothetical protein AURDEDRAFT_116057 [Auricularia subglabra TFB-10046 SS5]|uniref:F-box domain-containing protein n=1 Tax=Auricularia subglabra (strain TFB-10046 / SS5) TaxID=717982 RepID=J0LJ51_AURST|nr:hypothetical protein AURDEDRAFT_116057 [Auricularia subglabra TFB-10046 SS5]